MDSDGLVSETESVNMADAADSQVVPALSGVTYRIPKPVLGGSAAAVLIMILLQLAAVIRNDAASVREVLNAQVKESEVRYAQTEGRLHTLEVSHSDLREDFDRMDARVIDLQKQITQVTMSTSDRIARIETRLTQIDKTLRRIEEHLIPIERRKE